jgi:hypothetical protein
MTFMQGCAESYIPVRCADRAPPAWLGGLRVWKGGSSVCLGKAEFCADLLIDSNKRCGMGCGEEALLLAVVLTC